MSVLLCEARCHASGGIGRLAVPIATLSGVQRACLLLRLTLQRGNTIVEGRNRGAEPWWQDAFKWRLPVVVNGCINDYAVRQRSPSRRHCPNRGSALCFECCEVSRLDVDLAHSEAPIGRHKAIRFVLGIREETDKDNMPFDDWRLRGHWRKDTRNRQTARERNIGRCQRIVCRMEPPDIVEPPHSLSSCNALSGSVV